MMVRGEIHTDGSVYSIYDEISPAVIAKAKTDPKVMDALKTVLYIDVADYVRRNCSYDPVIGYKYICLTVPELTLQQGFIEK